MFTTNGAHILAEVYNLAGQKVATLVNSDYGRGTHSVKWNGNGAGSGHHVIRIWVGGVERLRHDVLIQR